MDLDHYSGNIKALFHAALATSDNDMDPWKPFISRKMPHNTQFYYGVLIGLSGLTLGYTLHMKMDGLI
jgi:hypothetical protein